MRVPLLVAGILGVLAAAVHGVGGEVLVVRRLSPATLPGSALGGPATTRAMIRATWHLTTVGFLAVGFALVLAGTVLHGDTGRGVALVAAGASSGFAAVVVGTALARGPRSLLHHPAPAVLTATAVLAWWGIAG